MNRVRNLPPYIMCQNIVAKSHSLQFESDGNLIDSVTLDALALDEPNIYGIRRLASDDLFFAYKILLWLLEAATE